VVLSPGESILGPVPSPGISYGELSLAEEKSFSGISSPQF
jgi:hypothetical protein